jgi:hypothetical protein
MFTTPPPLFKQPKNIFDFFDTFSSSILLTHSQGCVHAPPIESFLHIFSLHCTSSHFVCVCEKSSLDFFLFILSHISGFTHYFVGFLRVKLFIQFSHISCRISPCETLQFVVLQPGASFVHNSSFVLFSQFPSHLPLLPFVCECV